MSTQSTAPAINYTGTLTPNTQQNGPQLTPQQLIDNAKTPAQIETTQINPGETDVNHDANGNWQPSSGGLLNKFTHGMFGKVAGALVNSGGRTPQDTVDASGAIHEAATAAAPGQLFKNLLIGSLMGLGAAARNPRGGFLGAVGSGFTGGLQEQQELRQQARNEAVQNFQLQKQAQEAQDKHATASIEQARNAASIANLNANTHAIGVQMARFNQQVKDEGYKNGQNYLDRQIQGGGLYAGRNKSWADVQQFMNDNKGSTHKYTARAIGQDEVKDADGKPVIGADGKPEMEDIYDIVQLPDAHKLTDADIKTMVSNGVLQDKDYTAGQTVSGDIWNGLENKLQIKQHQDLQNKQVEADIKARQAQANAAQEEAGKYALDIRDAKDREQATKDYGAALQEAGNDTAKAQTIMQQKYPKSYQLLAAAEQMSLVNSPYTEEIKMIDNTPQKVSVPRQRLFTSPIISQQQQAILDRATKEGKKVTVSGPKGTFLIDPRQFSTYLDNGYNLAQTQVSTGSSNPTSQPDARSLFQKQYPNLSEGVGIGIDAVAPLINP